MSADIVPIRKFEQPEALEPKVLGALLDNGAHLKAMLAASGLSEESFTSSRGKAIWRIVRFLVEKERSVSALAVISAGRLARAFGPQDEAFITQVELENVVTPEQLSQVLDDFRAARRALGLSALLRSTADAIDSRGIAPDAVWQTLGAARNLLQEEAPDATAATDVIELLDAWERNERAGKSLLVPTGIKILDEMIGGYPHSLTIVAGEPGSGKTGFIASSIRAQLALDPNLRVGVFGLEDGTSWLTRRWLAADSGVPLREVGWGKRSDEQRATIEAAGQAAHDVLARVTTFKLNKIRISELVRRCAAWKRRHGVGCIFIDNASQFELRTGAKFEQPFELLAQGLEDLRQWAIDEGVAVVLLSHTNVEQGASKRPGPPALHSMRGGRAGDQKARLMLGLWKKNSSWRCTMLKGNELAEAGETIEFERIPAAGLIEPGGGRLVNLDQEASSERKEAAEARDAAVVERRAKMKAAADQLAAKAKAEAEEAIKPPQAALPLEGA